MSSFWSSEHWWRIGGFLTWDVVLLFSYLISMVKLLFFFFFRVKVCTKTDGTVNIHPKSVNVEETEFHYNWLVYHLKMRTSSVCRGLYLLFL